MKKLIVISVAFRNTGGQERCVHIFDFSIILAK